MWGGYPPIYTSGEGVLGGRKQAGKSLGASPTASSWRPRPGGPLARSADQVMGSADQGGGSADPLLLPCGSPPSWRLTCGPFYVGLLEIFLCLDDVWAFFACLAVLNLAKSEFLPLSGFFLHTHIVSRYKWN